MEHEPSTQIKLEMGGLDHSKMNRGNMPHPGHKSMGIKGHDHHAMMIKDFKNRFYVVLALTVPIMLLSAKIQNFMSVHWQFSGS